MTDEEIEQHITEIVIKVNTAFGDAMDSIFNPAKIKDLTMNQDAAADLMKVVISVLTTFYVRNIFTTVSTFIDEQGQRKILDHAVFFLMNALSEQRNNLPGNNDELDKMVDALADDVKEKLKNPPDVLH